MWIQVGLSYSEGKGQGVVLGGGVGTVHGLVGELEEGRVEGGLRDPDLLGILLVPDLGIHEPGTIKVR